MKKQYKILLTAGTVLYGAVLFFLLFLKGNRGIMAGADMKEYMAAMCNFKPFATIARYVRALKSGSMNAMIPIKNLAGNFVLFMPFAFILHAFTGMKTGRFLLITFLTVLGVETAQLLTRTGSFDVDDIILNVSGAVLMYLILAGIDRKKQKKA